MQRHRQQWSGKLVKAAPLAVLPLLLLLLGQQA
jgi:hypothetical protein